MPRSKNAKQPGLAVPEHSKSVKNVSSPLYVLVYLDTDGQFKLEQFKDIKLVSDFIKDAKIEKEYYVLVYGEFLVGPAGIETSVPEAFIKDIDDESINPAIMEDFERELIGTRDNNDEDA